MGALQVHADDPLCAGPDPRELIDNYITPVELHYVRNHGPVPAVDEQTFRLTVDGLVGDSLVATVSELRTRFLEHEVTATLQCAGNRRSELHALKEYQNEVLWTGDAIGNAVWKGVRLTDVLSAVRPDASATHVWFEGLDVARAAGSHTTFGASIRIARATDPDVLLAFEMNGEPLTALHGSPVRVVVPGAIGARSVKWLSRVTLADRESENHFQARSYRLGDEPIEWAPLNSYICVPAAGEQLPPGRTRVSGYATAEGVAVIARVEVRVDAGPWSECVLIDERASGVWSRWVADVQLEAGEHRLSVRAHDSSGSSQRTTLKSSWNSRGYLNNAIHSVDVRVEPDV